MPIFDRKTDLPFNTQWNFVPDSPDVNPGESIAETLGYRDVEQQVESFLIAGTRLDAFRSGYYDDDLVGPGEDLIDIELPVGREPYSDFSDVQESVNKFSDHWRETTARATKEREAKIAADTGELEKLRAEAKIRETSRPRSLNENVNNANPAHGADPGSSPLPTPSG
jgi:hypothetical protein